MRRLLCALVATATHLFGLPAALALDIKFEPVAPNVYAYVGDTGGRTRENQGLNANIGLVVTPAGAVLIDSGSTYQVAQHIEQAARLVTNQPIKWVVNTGGQDHRWLGNGYFASRGAQLMAHANAVADMNNRGGDHLTGLQQVLGDKVQGTQPTLPQQLIEGALNRMSLGGVAFEFVYAGGAHTPGDMLVWLPQQQVLFSGDVVYVDRMLGVLPVSRTKQWLESFAAIESLAPTRIVPGHGRVTTLTQAQTDTVNYLKALRAHMAQAVEEGTDISAAVASFDSAPFKHLLNAGELMPGNASRVYLELERELFQ